MDLVYLQLLNRKLISKKGPGGTSGEVDHIGCW